MNIIIPMAGMGKRLRPHTLTTPKPLIPIAGKPIVWWLVHDIVGVIDEKIDNIGFVVSRSVDESIQNELLDIAEKLGAYGHLFYQEEALGTAHAIYCAKNILKGPVIVAFADTLFKANFKLDTKQDGIVWVHKVKDPSAFGVVKLNESNEIIDFIDEFKTLTGIPGNNGFGGFENQITVDKAQYLVNPVIPDHCAGK